MIRILKATDHKTITENEVIDSSCNQTSKETEVDRNNDPITTGIYYLNPKREEN